MPNDPELKPWPRVTDERLGVAIEKFIEQYDFGIKTLAASKFRSALTALSLLPTAEVSGAGVKVTDQIPAGYLSWESSENIKWGEPRIVALSSKKTARYTIPLYRETLSLKLAPDVSLEEAKGEAQVERDRLPNGHVILEQADLIDGRVAQTVLRPNGTEYERIVDGDEAYGAEE